MNDLLAGAILLLLLSPSLLRLLALCLQFLRGQRFDSVPLHSGIWYHIAGTVVSPGVPAYLYYVWSKCGPGCGSGAVLIVLLPVSWLLYTLGNRRLKVAKLNAGSGDA